MVVRGEIGNLHEGHSEAWGFICGRIIILEAIFSDDMGKLINESMPLSSSIAYLYYSFTACLLVLSFFLENCAKSGQPRSRHYFKNPLH